ncbi:MAG: ABC transporter permease subunit [Streptosporangiales bacterium]|nr:ABC transporter permease subunit [Streptosporangiales bacterium]
MLRERLFFGDRVVGLGLVIAFCAVTVLPLLYMVSLSLQSETEVLSGDPVLWPETPRWDNFAVLFDSAPIARFVLNSLIMAGAITLSHLIFDPLIGYVFAKFTFPFKNTLFLVILATLMVPFFVRMIPLYVMMSNVGWLDSYQGLIVPFLMDAYGIFLMRQFISPLPDELIDAARVDGASELRIFARVILPQTKPALAVLGLFTFVFQWNEFLWPLVATSREEMRTMTVGLSLFNREAFTLWNLTAAGAVILFIPTIILFFVSQRYLVRGIALTGLK